MSFLHLIATMTLELCCIYTASFSKELKVFCAWGGDRQTDMHSLVVQTSHSRTSTCRTFILRIDYWGGCGLWGPGGEIRPQGGATQYVIRTVGLAAGAPLPDFPSSFVGLGPDHHHQSWSQTQVASKTAHFNWLFSFAFGNEIFISFPRSAELHTDSLPDCLATWQLSHYRRKGRDHDHLLGWALVSVRGTLPRKARAGLNCWTIPFVRSLGR